MIKVNFLFFIAHYLLNAQEIQTVTDGTRINFHL